jgi:3-oxoacyl-[acyl-carrier protein] reductase
MFASLAGRSVIVTGASKGIGRGIAKRFAEAGCRDISTEAGAAAMANAALGHFGSIDILCANAGIFPSSKIGDMSVAEFDEVMGVNLRGTFLAVRACLPELTKT